MRMFHAYGEPLYMKDGVAMELTDGAVIIAQRTAFGRSFESAGRSALEADSLSIRTNSDRPTAMMERRVYAEHPPAVSLAVPHISLGAYLRPAMDAGGR